MKHDREWAKGRLACILGQAAATDEYKKAFDECLDDSKAGAWDAIASIAVDLVKEGFIFDLTEDHLIPGLAAVNEKLQFHGCTLQVYLGKGNHITKISLEKL